MTYVITKYVHRELQPVAEKAGHWLAEFFALKDVKKVVIDINSDLVDCSLCILSRGSGTLLQPSSMNLSTSSNGKPANGMVMEKQRRTACNIPSQTACGKKVCFESR